MPDPQEAEQFVCETKVDALAVAISDEAVQLRESWTQFGRNALECEFVTNDLDYILFLQKAGTGTIGWQ